MITISTDYNLIINLANLQKKADEINRKNLELSELVKYLNTPEYTEREARERLNLKKEGEIVVAIPNQLEELNNENSEPSEPSNPSKWFDYFFSP